MKEAEDSDQFFYGPVQSNKDDDEENFEDADEVSKPAPFSSTQIKSSSVAPPPPPSQPKTTVGEKKKRKQFFEWKPEFSRQPMKQPQLIN